MRHIRLSPWQALLALCLLCGCKGAIVSTAPLIATRDAAFPLASGTEIVAETLDDHNVWQREDRTARILIADGAYGIVDPGQSAPSSDRFLVRPIGNGEFVVQGSSGNEWAYGLIVHADRYYVFTFNRPEQGCTDLSADERGRFHVTVKDDQCYVASQRDLIGLLRYLRRRYPTPASAFVPSPSAPHAPRTRPGTRPACGGSPARPAGTRRGPCRRGSPRTTR
jgi:hypothetical protein